MIRAPVARASSSIGWAMSGSTTMIRFGRPVAASFHSTGMVIASSPVNTVASLTARAHSLLTGLRHSTEAAAIAPTIVAARQTNSPSCKARGSCPGHGAWP